MNRCLFIGSKRLGLACLKRLVEDFPKTICAVVTIDDSHEPRSELSRFVLLSQRTDIPIHIISPNEDLRPYLERYEPALVFVCGWYRLIAPELLFAPIYGFVGIHNSLLPKYRGGAPLVWAMINGEKETGFSLFQLSKGMDDGPLFAQHRVSIHEEDSIGDLLIRIEEAAPAIIAQIYPSILTGILLPQPQTGTPSYAAQRLPKDGRIFWNWPQKQIHDFIRAQCSPYPGAFFFVGEEQVIIHKSKKLDMTYYGIPGQVISNGEGMPLVICGDQKPLQIEEICYKGKNVSPRILLNSGQIRLLDYVRNTCF